MRDATQTLPAGTPLSQPYWLREDGTAGMFRVDDPTLIGRPENPPAFPVEYVFEVGGQTLVDARRAGAGSGGRRRASTRRRLEVIPPVSLQLRVAGASLFAPGAHQGGRRGDRCRAPGPPGSLRLEAPAAGRSTPAAQPFRLAAVGDHAKLTFTVTAPPQPATGEHHRRRAVGDAHVRQPADRNPLSAHPAACCSSRRRG